MRSLGGRRLRYISLLEWEGEGARDYSTACLWQQNKADREEVLAKLTAQLFWS